MSLTELLERVDWSQMTANLTAIRSSRGYCPLQMATGVHEYGYTAATRTITGIQGPELQDAILRAADMRLPNTPIAARWRQWMLEKIHGAKR